MNQPITLATLEHATAQQVFDQVARHLMTQGRTATYDGGCVYRTEDGLKCAAGCLIADGEYNPNMEGSPWDRLVFNGIVPSAHDKLIASLQHIHDKVLVYGGNNRESWRKNLYLLAMGRNLSPVVLHEFPVS